MDSDFRRGARRPYANIVTSSRRAAATPRPHTMIENNISGDAHTHINARKKSSHKKRWLILLGTILLTLGSLVGGYIYIHKDDTPLDSYAGRFDFPLYFPVAMPREYRLAESSIKPTGDVLVYTLQSPTNPANLILTQQLLPSQFDATRLITKDAQPLKVTAGTLYRLSGGDKSKYMLTAAGGTLIFINTTGKVGSEVINSLAASLQKLD